jgi:predicted nucleotidyltransferase
VHRARHSHCRAPDPARSKVQDSPDSQATTADGAVGAQRVSLGGGPARHVRRPGDSDEGAIAPDELRLNRDRIRRAAHRHGASNVQVFGSVARGQDQPESDIDLLVDLDVRTRGLFPIAALQDELSALLGERVDVVPQDALAPHVARSALTEAVPL